MSLSSAQLGLESFSSGRPPFIAQGGRVHRCWTPTDGPNKDVYFTIKKTLMVLQWLRISSRIRFIAL